MESDLTDKRIIRGGNYDNGVGAGTPASYRYYYKANNSLNNIGFRVTLYIKN